MGNECCKPERHGRDRNRRREPSEQGTEFQNLPPNRVVQSQAGVTQGISTIPLNAPQQQTQVGQQSNPRQVRGEDFNNYMRVNNMQIVHQAPINQPHEAGHSFVVEFTVTNTTSDYLRFTNVPAVVWREIEHKQENIGGQIQTTAKDHDLYAENPGAQTFYSWRTNWDNIIAPNETRRLLIQDVPRLRNIDRDANGQPRTVSRRVDFDVRVPGNAPRVRATQNVQVVNGVTENINFQVN